MKIIYNYDGSIKDLDLEQYINQGNNGVNHIDVAIEGRDNDSYTCEAVFELPNGQLNSLTGVAQTVTDGDDTYNGYRITITAAQTYLAGLLKMSVHLVDLNDNELATYKQEFIINEAPYDPDEVYITVAQYNSMVQALNAKQSKYTQNNVRAYYTLANANSDLTNLAYGQIIFVKGANEEITPYLVVDDGGVKSLSALKLVVPGLEVNAATSSDDAIVTTGLIKQNGNTVAEADITYSAVVMPNNIQTFSGRDLQTLVDNKNACIYYTYQGFNRYFHRWGINPSNQALFAYFEVKEETTGQVTLNTSIIILNTTTGVAGISTTTKTVYSKSAVDTQIAAVNSAIATVKANAFTLVNTSTYPTLNDFLATSGNEGYVYLYPIDTGDLTKGYYQYIWENSSWLALGTTVIDLSDYYTKSQADAKYVDLTSNQSVTGYKTFKYKITIVSPNGTKSSEIRQADGGNFDFYLNGSVKLRYSLTGDYWDVFRDFNPHSDNTYNLGSASYTWKNIYVKGTLNDGTHAITVQQMTEKADDSAVVHNTGNETIAGNKDFTGEVSFTGGVGSDIVPNSNNAIDIGSSLNKIKDLYIAGAFKDGTNSLSLQNIVDFQATVNEKLTQLFEAVIFESTLSYSYLQWSAIPNNISSYPIVFSGGSEMTNVKGNSCVVNQLTDFDTFETTQPANAVSNNTINYNENHKYLIVFDYEIADSYSTTYFLYGVWNSDRTLYKRSNSLTLTSANGKYVGFASLTQGSLTDFNNVSVIIQCLGTFTSCKIDNAQLFDLTIIGLDSLTTVDEVRSALLQRGINIDEYNAYNVGSIKNSKATTLNVYDSNNNLKDTYPLSLPILRGVNDIHDDKEKVRIGVVDLGTFNWAKNDGHRFLSTGLQDIAQYPSGLDDMSNIICSKYTVDTPRNVWNETNDKTISLYNNANKAWLLVEDTDYNSASDFKTAMSGVYLLYELATPTDQVAITLPDDIAIEKGDSFEVVYDNNDNCGADFDFAVATSKIKES